MFYKVAKLSFIFIIYDAPDIPSLSALLKRASITVEKRCFEAFFVEFGNVKNNDYFATCIIYHRRILIRLPGF